MNYKDYKAVIFDLDGTLIDSMWLWTEIDIEYLSKYDYQLPKTLRTDIEGMSFTEAAVYFKENFHIKDSIEDIKDEWNRSAYEKYAKVVELKEGVREFLDSLKENNIKMGIATSNSKELVDACLDRLKVRDYFESIRTACEVEKGKPAPDIYLKVASDLNVEPKNCLVFEDVVKGIQAGKNAGMKVCAVYDDFSKADDDKKKAEADFYIDTFKQLNEK